MEGGQGAKVLALVVGRMDEVTVKPIRRNGRLGKREKGEHAANSRVAEADAVVLAALKNPEGVSVPFLAALVGTTPPTVKNRLASLAPISRGNRGFRYDFLDALAFLIKPKIDFKELITTLSPKDLPAALTKEYWDAMLKRQAYELRAGDLWRTSDVVEVLSDAFAAIKNQMQTWAEDVERHGKLDREQYVYLSERVDALRLNLYNALVAMAEAKRTEPIAAEMEELAGDVSNTASADSGDGGDGQTAGED